MHASGDWRGRLRRWRWLIATIVLAIAVRVALPEIIRRVAISQASQNLRARIDLGNVDLYLWRGGIVLEDFALRPLAPGETSGSEPPAPGTPPQPAIVAFKKLAVGLSFKPFWHKTIQLYEVVLESPQIALDRLADGQLNVMSILPASEQAADVPPSPTPAEPVAAEGGWRFGVDRLAVGTGKLVFHDLMVEGSEPVEVGIPSIEVSDIALDPQVYGGPLNSKVKILLDEGSLELGAKLALHGETTTLDAELEAQGLPLRRSRLYVPDVGWSDLRGLLDASLHYQLETGTKNEVRGKVSLRDVAISVPQLPEAALWWKTLDVTIDPIDLQNQYAHVTSVALDGAVLSVEPQSADQLPVLARRAKAVAKTTAPPVADPTPADTPLGESAGATPFESPSAPSTPAASAESPSAAAAASPTDSPSPTAASIPIESPDGTPASTSPPEESPAPTPESEPLEAKPWGWAVDSLKLSNTLVRLLSPDAPLDISVAVEMANLDDNAETAANLDLHLAAGEGTIAVKGEVRIAPPGFGGTVVIANLAVPELIAASGALPESPLLSAQLGTDLAVSAGLAAAGAPALGPQDLQVSGKINLAALRVAPPGMKDAEVGAQTVDVALTSLELPAILAPHPVDGSTPPEGNGDLRLQGEIVLADARVALAAGKDLLVGAKSLRFAMTKLELPGLLAPPPADGAAAPEGTGDLRLQGQIDVTEANVSTAEGKDLNVGAKTLRFAMTELELPGLLAPPPADGAAAPGRGDLRLQGQIDVTEANISTAEGKDLNVGAETLRFVMTKLELPGLLAPPPADGAAASEGTGDLRLQGQIDVTEANVSTAGGKDLNVGAKNLRFAMTNLELPGLLAPPLAEGTAAPAGRGDFRLQGEIALVEPRIAKDDGKDLLIGAKNVRLAMTKIDMPGLLLSPPPAVAATKQVALRELNLDAPLVHVTRTESGFVLPGPQPSPAPSPAAQPAAEADAGAAEAAKVSPPAPSGPPPLVLTLDSLRLTKGKIELADRAVKPPFNGGFDGLDISARDIRWPDLNLRQLNLKARTVGNGEISLTGDVSASGGELVLDTRNLDLPSFNPYAVSYSPFKIGGGALTLATKVKFKGDSYDVGNSITLHQLDLTGKRGQSLFEQNFGVPLSTALALLRDAQGDIAMDIPVQIDSEGTKVDVVGIAGGALRRALVNALASPLRLLGAVTGSGDKVESIAPAAIDFRLGRATAAGEGEKRLEQVGSFLASRPALQVELSTQPTQSDVRWLREQALLKTWDEEGFFASVVAKVSGGDARERIQQALVARGNDDAGKLSDEDAKLLDEWLAQQPQIPSDQIDALAAARLTFAKAAIARKVDPAHVLTELPAKELGEGDPQVDLKLQPVGAEKGSDEPDAG